MGGDGSETRGRKVLHHPPTFTLRARTARRPQRHRATPCRAVTPPRRASLVTSPVREARDTLRSDPLMHREALLRGVALRRTFLRRHQARVERAGRDEQRLEHGRGGGDVGSDLLGHGPSTFRARSQKAGPRVVGSSAHTSPVRARERSSRVLTAHHGTERTTEVVLESPRRRRCRSVKGRARTRSRGLECARAFSTYRLTSTWHVSPLAALEGLESERCAERGKRSKICDLRSDPRHCD
jgi:hypothetical protein